MTAKRPVFDLYGLRVASEIPLPAEPAPDAEADVEVVWGEATEASYRRPSTDLVAELHRDGWPLYTFSRMPDGHYRGRFYSLADFDISRDLRRVVCHADAGGDADLVPILLAGTVAAFLLMMRGTFVLHASCVAAGQGTIAFVGPPLQGKSTLAALCCAAGADLVTDDVLPLRVEERDVWVVPGSGHLRLRPGAATLTDRFGAGWHTEMTADERLALSPVVMERRERRLAAVVLPRPTRTESRLAVRVVRPTRAVGELVSVARIEGWRRPDDVTRWFDTASEVAERVAVLEMTVPWGPPFPGSLGRQVLDLAGAHTSL